MTTGMTTGTQPADELLTIDELAMSTGLTVRTTRYYASLGLLPAPVRRGRMAYYGQEHLARLQLIRALQEHGFTLAAIERQLATVPMSSTVEEIAVQRALLTAWRPGPGETMTRPQLEEMAGRPLTDGDLDDLARIGVVNPERHGRLRRAADRQGGHRDARPGHADRGDRRGQRRGTPAHG